MAFEFEEDRGDIILTYLTEREGRNFALRKLVISPQGEQKTQAIVPIYTGSNIIDVGDVDKLAAMVLEAKGSHGLCVNYIKGIAQELARLNIDDPVVTELWNAVQRQSRRTDINMN